MEQGLSISVVDPDDDYLGIELRAATDRFATAPECEPPGQLTTYAMETQNGTVARCEHRNESGDPTKRVYYASRQRSAYGPFVESDLVVREIVEFSYNDENQLARTDIYSSSRVLTGYRTRTYRADGTVVLDAFFADGTRHHRTIAPENSRKTVATFNDVGNTVVAIEGPVVEELDLPFGWGVAVQGISCGAAPNASRRRNRRFCWTRRGPLT